jgi:retinol dehydrogenase-12
MNIQSGNMVNKICLVTGATNGIGKVIASDIAIRGAQVVIVGRDTNKTNIIAEEIRNTSKNANIRTIIGDLSILTDIRRVANEFDSSYDRLDVLVNNAGALYMNRQETSDGFEKTFALNHLNYFLLTNLLLDKLKQSNSARIVSTSSMAHGGIRSLDFEDLPYRRKSYSAMAVYGESKLCNILFTYELARRLEGTNVTANCLHPGFVASGFGRNNGTIANIVMTLARPLAISNEKGARTSIYLATSPECEGVSGKYFVKSRPVHSSPYSYNQEAAKTLWELSEKLVK